MGIFVIPPQMLKDNCMRLLHYSKGHTFAANENNDSGMGLLPYAGLRTCLSGLGISLAPALNTNNSVAVCL